MRSPPSLAATLATTLLLVAAAACAGGSSTGADADSPALERCPTGTALLTTPPVDPDQLTGWVPLGNLNPPGHTFPTNHQYLYFTNPGSPTAKTVQLVAPGNVTITRARRTSYSPDGHADYAIEFAACAEVKGELGHVASIAPALLAQLGAFDQGCQQYSPNPGLSVSTCYTRLLRIPVAAGDALGTGGPTAPSLDFSLWDTRIAALRYANPSRWIVNGDGFDDFHVVAASDYFAEPARSRIAAKVGSFDGRVQRTALPLGGTIELDVAGSAQGAWLAPSQPTHPETPHLAIVPDPVDPTRIAVSVGASQPGFVAGSYQVAAGAFPESPATIHPDGQVHCYQLVYGGVILLQLVDPTTLRVEGRSGAAACDAQQPFAFRPGATFDYRR
jgi:hypothetical protein